MTVSFRNTLTPPRLVRLDRFLRWDIFVSILTDFKSGIGLKYELIITQEKRYNLSAKYMSQ